MNSAVHTRQMADGNKNGSVDTIKHLYDDTEILVELRH
jgi:hypothetical protein